MSSNIPVVVAGDSDKTSEFVERSGFGLCVEPTVDAFKAAIQELKEAPPIDSRAYILSEYSADRYGLVLNEGIRSVM
ncbi:MAG: hypothetical protein AAF492_28220, partial [Verrucomicrobiota bacterium]